MFQSSASRSDLFDQGKQFSDFLEVKGPKWKKIYYVKSLTIQIYGNLKHFCQN